MQTTRDDALFVELHRLVTECLEGVASAETVARLDELVAHDPDARRLYLEYLRDSIGLRYVVSHSDEELSLHDFAASDPDAGANESAMASHGLWPTTLDYFSSGWPAAYLVASLLLGVALLMGSWITVNHYADKAPLDVVKSDSPQPTKTPASDVVGRITALADCQWSVKRGEGRGERGETQIPKSPNLQIPVHLGDRFVLASGLMEITYDTGARVILQGPCMYEIDSDRGGYLAVGKLTARVEKGSGVRGPGSGKTRPSAFSLQPSALFAVRTPTATVTDLGTEFGVEVEESGATRSHVFQGKVELVVSGQRSVASDKKAIHLTAGQSARVERGRNSKVAITREPGQPGRFVRQISKSSNQQIVKSSPSSLILHPSSFAYRLVDLGTLGGTCSMAYAINDAGQIVGEADLANGDTHAFLYADGRMKDLGTLKSGKSCAFGINAAGHVVGSSGLDDDSRAFLFVGGVMKDLGSLGGRVNGANGINAAGQIVGASHNAHGVSRAFLYTSGGGMKDLGALAGPKGVSCATAINTVGHIVGYSETKDGGMHAFLFTPGDGMKDLGTFGGDKSQAFQLNDMDQIVGVAANAKGELLAFLHAPRIGMRGVGTVVSPRSIAYGINNVGQIVGSADTVASGNIYSFGYLYSDGKMTDLMRLAGSSAAGWTRLDGGAINNAGQIAGFGYSPSGDIHAFLLTPVKEGQEARAKEQGIEDAAGH